MRNKIKNSEEITLRVNEQVIPLTFQI